ncbi:unnamed protein product [Clonostachys rosea]|uniref:Uncharacterized protein n=1 Tax=Bionectria ochroleuca TaxID=29856 RepID=A0ABY6TNF9_BIOOC|nr:unnamed protein product [Clonostachys rosea]
MRLSLVYLAVFAAPSLVHGRRHKCSRSTPLSSANATPDISSGWSSTPPASVSPSSVIIASSETPVLSESSAVSPSASTSTPGTGVPTTFSTGTTPAGTPSSADVSATPSSTDVSSTPSLDLSSSSLSVSSSIPETPIASTTPAESTTLITQTTPSASTTPVSSTIGYKPYHDAPHLFGPGISIPDTYEKVNFYIEASTGHFFWVSDGVNNRYQFFTSYDEFQEIGEYYSNTDPGSVACYDLAQGLGGRHMTPIVCSRSGTSFSCTANTPAGVFRHFMVNSQSYSGVSFGTSVGSGWQEVIFEAVDVY